jgi:hypothetical protein
MQGKVLKLTEFLHLMYRSTHKDSNNIYFVFFFVVSISLYEFLKQNGII